MAQQQASSLAQAQGNLAMRGGLRSGSAERLAQQSQLNQLMGGQRLGAEFAQRGMAYDIQDEMNRQQLLKAMPQMDLAQAQFQSGQKQFNIQSALAEKQAERDAAMEKYRQEMSAWSAEQTARATPKPSKK